MDVNPNQASASQAAVRGALSRTSQEAGSQGTTEPDGPHQGATIPEPPARARGVSDPIASVLVQQELPPNTRLHVDEESNRIVAQILDENNEVVRQLPPQELLDISARFNRLQGLLFDEQR